MAVPNPSAIAHTAIVIGPGLSPLEGARIDVEINDLLAEFTLTQQFRNAIAHDIEAVFTFPIPMDAVFLGLSATLGERELEGRVVEKQQANREYEEAIASGDSAILVERTQSGMLTANIGNLKPGETITVRLKFAEWLAFNGNDVRFRMPTSIAPRYGEAQMVERDQPVTDLLAQYQFAAQMRVRGLLAKSQLTSPSHLLVISRDGDAVLLTLKSAWMDRDFLLDARFDDVDRCSAVADRDHDGSIVSVAIAADFEGTDEKLDVALVVDCSGSMGGTSITQARSALKQIVAGLQESDRVELIRFGSSHAAMFGAMRDLTRDTRSLLEEHITATEANLGGTETVPALQAAATILEHSNRKDERSRVIFLITDGAIYSSQIDALTARCRASGIRIFVVGVGLAGGVDVFQAFANATHGAAEIVHPNEDMATRVVRHFQRVRKGAGKITGIQWPGTPTWSHVPEQFYSGDTIRIFARFEQKVEGQVDVQWLASKAGQARLPIRHAPAGESISTLARMAASQRFALSEDRAEQVTVAIDYQLLTDVTSAILVAPRAEGDKAGDAPEVVRVPQMMAAGWGGMAGVCESRAIASCMPTASFDFCASMQSPAPKSSVPRSATNDVLRETLERIRTAHLPPPVCSPQEFSAFLQWLVVELQRIVDAGGNRRDALYAAILRWKRNPPGAHQKIIAAITKKATQPKPWLAIVDVLTQQYAPSENVRGVIMLIGAKNPALALIEADLDAARVDSQSIRIA